MSMSILYIRLSKYGVDIPRSGICGYISQPNSQYPMSEKFPILKTWTSVLVYTRDFSWASPQPCGRIQRRPSSSGTQPCGRIQRRPSSSGTQPCGRIQRRPSSSGIQLCGRIQRRPSFDRQTFTFSLVCRFFFASLHIHIHILIHIHIHLRTSWDSKSHFDLLSLPDFELGKVRILNKEMFIILKTFSLK